MSDKSNKIKPSEVPQILLSELQGIDLGAQYAEVGTVLQVSDGVVRIFGLRNAEASELLEFDGGMKAVVMNLEEDNVGAVLLGSTDLVKEGDMVRRTGRTVSIDVSESMLGRVINPLGEPIDGGGEISGEKVEMPLDRKAPGVIFRQPVSEPSATVRPERRPSPWIPSSTSGPAMRPGSRSTAYTWQWARRPQLWRHWSIPCASMGRWTIPWWWRRWRPILRRCVTMLHLLGPR